MSAEDNDEGCVTIEQVRELHRVLVAAVDKALRQPEPSAELLSVARRLVQDSGAHIEVDQRAMRRLWRLHLEKLHAALNDHERPASASMHAEVLRTLATAPMKDFADDIKARKAATKLLMAGLPFKVQ